MNNKKSQMNTMGIGTVLFWALIIGTAITLLIILANATDFGHTAWAKIKDVIPFV